MEVRLSGRPFYVMFDYSDEDEFELPRGLHDIFVRIMQAGEAVAVHRDGQATGGRLLKINGLPITASLFTEKRGSNPIEQRTRVRLHTDSWEVTYILPKSVVPDVVNRKRANFSNIKFGTFHGNMAMFERDFIFLRML
jgi:hypothetical protein